MNGFFCKVCSASCDGRLRNGVVACPACKSFFLRTLQSHSTLKCVSGFDNCPAVAIMKSAADGRRLRFICTKCRFIRCQQVGMNPPRSENSDSIGNGNIGNQIQLAPINPNDSNVKEMLNSLMNVFINTNQEAANTTPGVVVQMGPNVTNYDVAQCFLASSDHVAKLVANFLKANPLYKQVSMADRCSTFFQCTTRLNRIFLSAPATMNRDNFNKLCCLYPEFKVLFFKKSF